MQLKKEAQQDAFGGCHSMKICNAGHVPTENCRNCKLLNPLRINHNNNETKNGQQETHEIPTINDHASRSLQQPSVYSSGKAFDYNI